MVLDLIENDFFQLLMKPDKNVIIVGVDISSPVHIDNKKKYILIYFKGPTQGLQCTLTAKIFL